MIDLNEIAKEVAEQASVNGASLASSYYIEHSSIASINELQEFQDYAIATLNPKCRNFIVPRPQDFRTSAWGKGGVLFTARFELSQEIIGSLVGKPLRRSEYDDVLGIDLFAGRDCWFERETLYLSVGLVDRKYNHYGVMENLLLSAQHKLEDSQFDSLCFISAADNYPLIRTALKLGFYIVGVARHRRYKNEVFVFEFETGNRFQQTSQETQCPMIRKGIVPLELENWMDDDHVITHIDLHTRSYHLRKQIQQSQSDTEAA